MFGAGFGENPVEDIYIKLLTNVGIDDRRWELVHTRKSIIAHLQPFHGRSPHWNLFSAICQHTPFHVWVPWPFQKRNAATLQHCGVVRNAHRPTKLRRSSPLWACTMSTVDILSTRLRYHSCYTHLLFERCGNACTTTDDTDDFHSIPSGPVVSSCPHGQALVIPGISCVLPSLVVIDR